jgi:hypothetical protein
MNEGERQPTPESLWKSIDDKEGDSMEITWTPDELRALARSRERENLWGRRIGLALLIALAAAFAYNMFSISQLWVRLSQAWMLAWTGFLFWTSRHSPGRMSAAETSAGFLRRSFEGKRAGFLAIRWYLFLLIPPMLTGWLTNTGAAIRVARLKALGVDPSSRLYHYATGPWPFITLVLSLVLAWFAFGLAAKKATRELEELRRRTQG